MGNNIGRSDGSHKNKLLICVCDAELGVDKYCDSLSLNLPATGVNVSGCLLRRFNGALSDQEKRDLSSHFAHQPEARGKSGGYYSGE